MAVSGAQIVAEARTWIGTPFHHQANLKGVGVDCAGLLRGVCIALGLLPADLQTLPGASQFIGYGRRPDGVTMKLGCDTFMRQIQRAELLPGDAVLVRWEQDPQHVGIVGDYRHGGLSFIHSLDSVNGKGKVIEQRLTDDMRLRIVQAYRLPGVE